MTGARGRRRAVACAAGAAVAAAVAWLAWPAGVGAAAATRTASLRLVPTSGTAGTQVHATFAITGGSCPLPDGSPVRFAWDGSSLGTGFLDSATCSATFDFAAPQDTPGHHTVAASAQAWSRSAEFTENTTPTTATPAPSPTSTPVTLPVVTAVSLPPPPTRTPTPRPATPAPTPTATPTPTPLATPVSRTLDPGQIAAACPLAQAPCPSASPSPGGGARAGVVSGIQGPGGLGVLGVALIFTGLAAVVGGLWRRRRRPPRQSAPAPAAAVPGPKPLVPGPTWPGYSVTPPRGPESDLPPGSSTPAG